MSTSRSDRSLRPSGLCSVDSDLYQRSHRAHWTHRAAERAQHLYTANERIARKIHEAQPHVTGGRSKKVEGPPRRSAFAAAYHPPHTTAAAHRLHATATAVPVRPASARPVSSYSQRWPISAVSSTQPRISSASSTRPLRPASALSPYSVPPPHLLPARAWMRPKTARPASSHHAARTIHRQDAEWNEHLSTGSPHSGDEEKEDQEETFDLEELRQLLSFELGFESASSSLVASPRVDTGLRRVNHAAAVTMQPRPPASPAGRPRSSPRTAAAATSRSSHSSRAHRTDSMNWPLSVQQVPAMEGHDLGMGVFMPPPPPPPAAAQANTPFHPSYSPWQHAYAPHPYAPQHSHTHYYSHPYPPSSPYPPPPAVASPSYAEVLHPFYYPYPPAPPPAPAAYPHPPPSTTAHDENHPSSHEPHPSYSPPVNTPTAAATTASSSASSGEEKENDLSPPVPAGAPPPSTSARPASAATYQPAIAMELFEDGARRYSTRNAEFILHPAKDRHQHMPYGGAYPATGPYGHTGLPPFHTYDHAQSRDPPQRMAPERNSAEEKQQL